MKAIFSFSILSLAVAFALLWSPRGQADVRATQRPDPSRTLQNRYATPANYQRVPLPATSFGAYLRNLPLKPEGSLVKFYDGRAKSDRGVYNGVVDMELDNRDLQQCADAVMRLRGEYLFHQGQYDDIHFDLLSDGKPRYFIDFSNGDHSYSAFRKYMRYIFAYANTASLHDELVKVDKVEDVMPGDVFIQKGKPYGHAVMVMDVVENKAGDKMMLLAQSYMPAQDTQILINPEAGDGSNWYPVQEGTLRTPEWHFSSTDLRRFR